MKVGMQSMRNIIRVDLLIPLLTTFILAGPFSWHFPDPKILSRNLIIQHSPPHSSCCSGKTSNIVAFDLEVHSIASNHRYVNSSLALFVAVSQSLRIYLNSIFLISGAYLSIHLWHPYLLESGNYMGMLRNCWAYPAASRYGQLSPCC